MLFPEVINADVGTGSRGSEATKIMVPVCTLQLWDARELSGKSKTQSIQDGRDKSLPG